MDNCTCTSREIVSIVYGNDFTIEAHVSVYDKDEGIYKLLDLTGVKECQMRLVGTYRKAIGKDITVTGSKVTAFFPGGSVGVGTYGVEITFVDALGKGRIFERNLIRMVSASGDATVDNIIEGETGEGLNVTVNVLTRTVRIGTSGGSCVPDSALSETSENCVQNKVVTSAIRELQDFCFPTILSVSVSPLASEWKGVYQEVSVNWRVVKNGEQITPDSVVISFNGETKNVTPTSGSGTVKFTVTSPGSRNGVVTALAGGKNVGESPKSFSHTVYLPTYWGFSTVESAVGLDFGGMNNGGRSLNGTKTFTNDSDDKYLWLCVPEGNTITKVTSSGFDVIMNPPEEASTEYGKYKCYRSADLPGAGSITVTIA